ncbi:uncharacterized protein LOC111104825 [Crassostrea virginica]
MDSVQDIYKFDADREHQGLAIVIVNFTHGKYERKGAENDLKYMKKTFKRLGFKVECHKDVRKPDMQRLLEQYSKSKDLEKYSCFAFGISSHGIEFKERENKKFVSHHAVQMFDHDYMYTKDIIEYFRDMKCKALRNKPKMFFIQACRIPEDNATQAHYAAGVGFMQGIIQPLHEHQLQGSSRDATDHRESDDRDATDHRESADKDSFWEDFVSDTDDEDELFVVADNEDQNDIGEIEKNLEKRQVEILKNLRRLNKEAWLLKQGYSLVANQIKDQNFNASANQNIENDAQTAASKSEENDLQSAANQSQVQTSSLGTDDEVDPTWKRKYPREDEEPLHHVSVPCHNDMLIMFASPQGYYAYRNKCYGSYLLRYLYEVVEKHYKNGGLIENQINFSNVLTEVAAIMANRTYLGEKEYTIVPCVVNKLDRDIIFTQGKKMISSKFLLKISEIFTKRDSEF